MRKRKKDKTKLMAWVIVALMVLSVFGIIGASFFEEGTDKEYNGFRFYQVNGKWKVIVNGEGYFFNNLPTDLEDISVSGDFSQVFNGEKVYLAYTPSELLSVDGAMSIMGSHLYNNGVLIVKACLEEEDCPDIPIVNCEDHKIVKFVKGESGISGEGNCITLAGEDGFELVKEGERLVYGLLGIMS